MRDALVFGDVIDEIFGVPADETLAEILTWGNGVFVPLLMLLAGVAALVKLRGAFARVMTFLGFLVLALIGGFWGSLRLGIFEPHFLTLRIVQVLHFSVWGAWLLVVIGLFSVSARRLGVAGARDDFTGYADYGDPADRPAQRAYGTGAPLQQPGWGLATWWIVFSAIAWFAGVVWLLMYIDAQPRVSSREWREMTPFLVVYLLTLIPAVIFYFVWLHKAWSAVPARFRSATPGQAVGYLFIPFYNLYWVFRAIPGLSASIRRTMEATSPMRASGAGYGFGIAACVIALIPYVNQISWIFFLVWLCIANSAKNRMLVTLAAQARGDEEDRGP